MCGIFGISLSRESELSSKEFKDIVDRLFILSESRGKEASGLAGISEDKIIVHKSPLTAGKLIKSREYGEIVDRIYNNVGTNTMIGHSRLVTNGYEHFNRNNQPIISNGIIAVHNGIIVNNHELWDELESNPKTDLDSELIPVILAERIAKNYSMQESIGYLFGKIFGMTSTGLLKTDEDAIYVSTNNGSVYFTFSESLHAFIFTSEHYILNEVLKEKFSHVLGSFREIKQLAAGSMLKYDFSSSTLEETTFTMNESNFSRNKKEIEYHLEFVESRLTAKDEFVNTSMEYTPKTVPAEFEMTVEHRREMINSLKRCNKCTLPETFPFIQFDENGICNYCSNYTPIEYKGADKLKEFAEGLKRTDNRPECLVPFSGGRDSSFVLHYLVKELGLKPLAFSYDWGMITDLARRNQSRLCGELGVEHILVSADIRRKRKFIKQNVLAWLKKPDLGMVPLFMAGDKQYFYYTQKLLEENNLKVSFLGENLLETTNFKSGFAGVQPAHSRNKTYSLSFTGKMSMLGYYATQYLLNPAYINSSLLDTLGSFKSYYLLKHTSINLFSYIKWDETHIIDTLINEYDWETDPGTSTTWRICDGTAAFYNYIYYMVAGFTENDTFRSNQVREGNMTREQALEAAMNENQPRWDSIHWYCNTIGIDFEYAIKRINRIVSLFNTDGFTIKS